MSTSSIVELAQQISNNVSIIDKYHEKSGIPKPSFEIDTPLQTNYPDEIENARQQVFAATTDLRSLVLGPVDAMKVRAESYADLVSLHLIYKFGIAESFPVGTEARFKDIAKVSGLTEMATRRLLHHAMLSKIFKEPQPGVVAHTAATQALAEDESLKDYLGMCVDELWKSSTRVTDALQSWPSSTELGQTPYSLAQDNPLYVELTKYPERARRFGNAVRQYNPELTTLSPWVTNAYDWGSLGKATIVDIGGYAGALSIGLAKTFPDLTFIVQNSSDIIKERKPLEDPSIRDRIEFAPRNILTDEPVSGADVYYLRWNLHNLPDKHCIEVLRRMTTGFKTGAKILLHEFLLPDDAEDLTYGQTREMRNIDITHMVLWNTRERSLEQWADIFTAADPKYKFLGFTGTKESLQIMEAVWTG